MTASGRRPIYCGWTMEWGRERAEDEAKRNKLGQNCYEQMTATFKSVGSCHSPPLPPKKKILEGQDKLNERKIKTYKTENKQERQS